MCEFIKNEPKSSLRYTKMKLSMAKNPIRCFMADHLNLRCVRGVFHTNWPIAQNHFKHNIAKFQILHRNLWGDVVFTMFAKPKKRQSAEWKHPTAQDPKNSNLGRSNTNFILNLRVLHTENSFHLVCCFLFKCYEDVCCYAFVAWDLNTMNKEVSLCCMNILILIVRTLSHYLSINHLPFLVLA